MFQRKIPPKNPTENNSVSGEQTEQSTDANPTAAPVLEQAVEGGTANQEISQQAPVPPTESVAPRGQQTAFEQQVASPFTNPVSPTAPTANSSQRNSLFFRLFLSLFHEAAHENGEDRFQRCHGRR